MEKMYSRKCRILPFDSMYKKSILMKFGDHVRNDCGIYFDGRLNEVQLPHTYSTRHSVSGRLNLPVTILCPDVLIHSLSKQLRHGMSCLNKLEKLIMFLIVNV